MPAIAKAIYDHIYGLEDRQKRIIEKYGTIRYYQLEDVWRLTCTDGEAYVHYQTMDLVYTNVQGTMWRRVLEIENER